MSATSALEGNEDLENVTLVRMEDVQPDRNSDLYEILKVPPNVINTIIDHDYSCVLNDEDSNIGSMVSIAPEEVEEFIDIKPELSLKETTNITIKQDSWPTLEILPGGVIRHSEKVLPTLHQSDENETDERDLMYACAKCSERFKQLFSLVKHVKWHTDEEKKLKLSKAYNAARRAAQGAYVARAKLAPTTVPCQGCRRCRESCQWHGGRDILITRSMVLQKSYGAQAKKQKLLMYKSKCKVPKKK